MSYKNTFILVSPDCPVAEGVVPVSDKERKPIHVIQYELLAGHPYKYDYEELLFETHIRHKQISEDELRERGQEIRSELFAKKHACLRASALPKKYGWGIHYNEEGKIAVYPVESSEYIKFAASGESSVQLLYGMRSRKA